MGGALAAISTQVVGLDSVSFELSANALVMLVLGGIGTLYGALVGTSSSWVSSMSSRPSTRSTG